MNISDTKNRMGLCGVFLLMALCPGFFQPAAAQLATTAIYVGNQGNFSDANGSVSIFTPSTGAVITDGVPDLNTLVQNITLHEGLGYIMANTSDRVDVIDLNTNARIGQITDVPGPRYLTVVDETRAYVSNLFNNSVTIVDLAGNLATGSIAVGTNPEDIAVIGNLVYVANNGFGLDSTLSKIDVSSDALVETINLDCDGPRSLDVDGQDELWVLCTGKTVYNDDFTEIIEQTNGQVLVFDSATGEVTSRFMMDAQLGAASAGQDTHYDPVTDQLFAVQGNRVLVFDTTTNSQLAPIDVAGVESISGLAYDAAGNLLYLSRITSFTTAGFVSVHNREGVEVDRFTAGIVPATIALLQTGTSVAAEGPNPALVQSFVLHQNYPNPFNTSTTLSFETPVTTALTVKVYNLTGKTVATLADGTYIAGPHVIVWDAAGLPGGSYFVRVSSANFAAVRKMTLMK